MTSRLTTLAIVLFWLLSMTWLVATKVVPALQQGTPPDLRDEFARQQAAPPPPVAWNLYWNDQAIGYTVSQAFSDQDEPAEFRSVMQLEQIPVNEVAREFLGSLSLLTTSIFGKDNARIDLTVATRLRLDWQSELDGFESAVRMPDLDEPLIVRGNRTDEGRLRLSLHTGGTTIEVPQDFALPPKSRYAEALNPRSRMLGLKLGQRWTTPVVNPLLPSNQTVRLVESHVESRETIIWQQQPLQTHLIVYRYDSGSGAASRAAVGKAWVADDGLVVRQELPIGNATIRFERATDDTARELGKMLDRLTFEKFLRSPAPKIDSPE
jgi:hypothetical protein